MNPVSFGPRIHRQVLSEAVLLVLEDHTLPTVTFSLAVRRGAGAEPPGRSGTTLATLEGLLRGTVDRPRAEFSDLLEELGTHVFPSVGPHLSALNGACLRRNFDRSWEFLLEALLRPAFAEDEIARYRDETLEELRAERDEDRAVAEVFLRRALYTGHPLGRAPAGEIADLAQLVPQWLHELHGEILRPDALVAVFGGDITPEHARAKFGELVAALESRDAALVSTPPVDPVAGLRIVIIDKPERTQVQLRLATMGCSAREDDALAFWLGVLAFGGTFTSPLTREVRDQRGWSYTAHAAFDRYAPAPAPVVLRSAPATGDAVDCLELELDLFERLRRGQIEPDAVTFARSYALNRHPFEIATVGDLIRPAIFNELLGRSPEHLSTVAARLAVLDPDDVVAALRRHFDHDTVVVTLVATADDVRGEIERRFPKARVDVVDFRDGLTIPSD